MRPKTPETPTLLALAVVALLAAAILLAGCEDSTTPQPPKICFDLKVQRSEDCGLEISMLIEPSCAARDSAYARSLKARHDFDNDGTWDTGFWSMFPFQIIEPINLPRNVWVVRSEVLKANGDTIVVESSLDLPEWMPSPPDIIAAHCGLSDAPVDTLPVGRGWTFYSRAVHWMNSSPGPAIARYYIDGEIFHEIFVGFDHPLEVGCHFSGKSHPGFSEPGTHELKVVWDVDNIIEETDEDNNEIVKTLVVVPE